MSRGKIRRLRIDLWGILLFQVCQRRHLEIGKVGEPGQSRKCFREGKARILIFKDGSQCQMLKEARRVKAEKRPCLLRSQR